MSAPNPDNPTRPARARDALRRLPAWKKLLLGLSCLLMAAGLALEGYATLRRREPPTTRPTSPAPPPPRGPGARGLLPMPSPTPPPQETPADVDTPAPTDWQPAVFRLGFSFFAGFCIAYALRVFFRLSLLICGVFLLGLFGLQYAGIVQVNWQAMAGHYDNITTWLAGQFDSFRGFITGYLPSATAGAAGMVVGFRRH